MSTGRTAGAAGRWTARIAGWSLLLVPLLPLRRLFGELPATASRVPPGEWLLGLFVFGTMAVLLARLVPASIPSAALERLEAPGGPGRAVTGAMFGILAVLLFATATWAFGRRPLLIDSIVQLFQARIFADGAAFAPAPPGEAFFAVQHMVADAGRWYSQYPPGHAALLALGVKAGAAWPVPILLSLGSAAFLYGFALRAYGRATARLTLLLLALAPFFWFMGASHMNHVSTLFFVSAALFLLAAWEERGGSSRLLAAGLAIGAAFLSRPLTAVAVGAALGLPIARTALRRRAAIDLLAGLAGAMAVAAVFLAYNAATTGDPLLPGYLRLWGTSHGLGFHATPWGGTHTPLLGLRNELTDLSLLSGALFEWSIPAFLPVGLMFAAGWGENRWDGRLLAGFAAIPAAYFFYWHRDAFLGPRFLYSAVAFIVPLTARAIVVASRRLAERPLWSGSAITRVPARSAAAWLILLNLAYCAGYAAPRRFRVYRTGLASMKIDLRVRAHGAGIDEALVFVPVSWGNRLLARLRGIGVEAYTAEAAYRRVDHCSLELLLVRAERESWPSARFVAALGELPRVPERLGEGSPNLDPTLRLAGGRPLAPRCIDQIRYDRLGYTNYAPHLADQNPRLRGPLVFARDLRERNVELQARYPDLPAYLSRGDLFIELEATDLNSR